MSHSVRLALVVVLLVSGCGDGSSDDTDASIAPGVDAAAPRDARPADDGSAPSDASAPVDGSLVLEDGGEPSDGGSGELADPSAPGPYEVEMSTGTITGGTAVAFVPTLPDGARAPLVILKHGFQLATSNYAMTAARIASHGFVVVGVDTGGGAFGGPTNVDERDASIAAIDWATSAAPFAARVDAERIAVLGHSRGGKVAVMIAAADARVDAALLLDPVNGCGPGAGYSADCPDVTSDALAGALTIPVGVMGETNNATGGFMPCAPAAQNYQTIYDALDRSSWSVAWTFTGADHMDFTDDGGGFAGSFCADGPGDDAMIREQVRALAVAFLRRHLGDELAMDPWLVGASLPTGVTREGP